MDIENLTTVDEPHVNSEEQESLNEEVSIAEEPESQNIDNSISNEQAEADAYSDAWDKADLNDDKVFDNLFSDTNDSKEPAAPDLLSEETTQNTNNNIGAFMADKPVLKYRGKDIPIDNEQELIALAQKGFSYETEMANIKPQKKVINIVDGIPLEVLQAVADIHGGNKEAISFIKSQYGIEDSQPDSDNGNFWNDSSDVKETPSEEPKYTPEVKQDNPIEDFWADYSRQNQSIAAKASDIYGELEDSFKTEIYQPNVFQAFVGSVESGEFEKAYPIAIREKSLNPAMTWLQAYGVAVSKVGETPAQRTEPPANVAPPANSNQSRVVSETAQADRVWSDDSYFQELESKLFG